MRGYSRQQDFLQYGFSLTSVQREQDPEPYIYLIWERGLCSDDLPIGAEHRDCPQWFQQWILDIIQPLSVVTDVEL